MERPQPARQRIGRPRVYAQPRRELYLRVPEDLLQRVDAASANRTVWIVEAIRQRLERDKA